MPVEGEEPGEEEHGGAHLAPGADPAAAQAQRQGHLGGQHGRVVLVRAGDEAAGWTGVGMVLVETKGKGMTSEVGCQGAPGVGWLDIPPPTPITSFIPTSSPVVTLLFSDLSAPPSSRPLHLLLLLPGIHLPLCPGTWPDCPLPNLLSLSSEPGLRETSSDLALDSGPQRCIIPSFLFSPPLLLH